MKPSLRADMARLVAAQICLHACMTGLRLAAPLAALRDGHSALAVGCLLALFALSQVFLALPIGRFVDRHGIRRPLRLAILVASAGTALAAAFPVFGVLCLSALCCGAGTGLAVIALQRHVGRMAGNATELRQVFSWLSIGPSVSNFLGPMLAGLIIDAAGFRAAYLALALLPWLTVLWLHRINEPPRPVPSDRGGSGSSWNLLRDAAFRRLMVVNWMLSSCWDVHTFMVPVLGHERGFSASTIGAILGGFALAATAVRLVLPLLAARLREPAVIGGAMACTAVLFALYPLVQTVWAMAVLSLLLGLALGSVQPMVMSTLHQITPRHRHGEALGLRSMAINGSSVLMPLVFGVAGVALGASGVFWAVGAAVGLGSRLAWRAPAAAHPAD